MILTLTCNIKRLSKTKYSMLKEMCKASNILKKSSVVSICALYGRGGLGTPVKIRVA